MLIDTRPLLAEREILPAGAQRLPLILDLDGTLLRTNLLLEGALRLLRRRPLALFVLIAWAIAGRAVLKARLAAATQLSIDLLPINHALLDHARLAQIAGREVYIATAAHIDLAQQVAARFPFVVGVIASSGTLNLKGRHKAEALTARFPDGFVYAGDAAADLHVWRRASLAIYAGDNRRLAGVLRRTMAMEAEFLPARANLRVWLKALRIHQWVKNALLVLPPLLAGRLFDPGIAWLTLGAFVAMGLTASATYIVNDLSDLEDDRRHWTKCRRPIASGAIPIAHAIGAAIVLLATGIVAAAAIGGLPLTGAVLLYCAVTLGYSLHLKRIPLLDTMILAGLFTLRIGIGSAATGIAPSSWLLVFSMFLFLSLALAKRAGELYRLRVQSIAGEGEGTMHGRGYQLADAPFVQALGVATATTSVLILVLYLVDEAFPAGLYGQPRLLWAVPALIGLWLGRVWLLCGRGQLADDPVLFAIRDRTSLWLGAIIGASFLAAALIPSAWPV